jgi:hypothetical protein
MTGTKAAPHTCGGCTACCHTLPVPEVPVRAFEHCRHERLPPSATIGCAIYPRRPSACRLWSCQWLLSPDWPDELRPDRCGAVVDSIPDLVVINGVDIHAYQIWVEPGYEDAFRTNRFIQNVICGALDEGSAVLWRVAGAQSGEQLARVLFQAEGKLVISDVGLGNSTMSEAERQERAMQLQPGLTSARHGLTAPSGCALKPPPL